MSRSVSICSALRSGSNGYGLIFTLSSPSANCVASMLRSMYGRSFVDSAGWTMKRW